MRESQVYKCLGRSVRPVTSPHQTFPSHRHWSRTRYVAQSGPFRNLLSEAKERDLVFWVMKRLPKLIFSMRWRKPICSQRERSQESESRMQSHVKPGPPMADTEVCPQIPLQERAPFPFGQSVLAVVMWMASSYQLH